MTREDANKIVWKKIGMDVIHDLLDKIYDDFESRACDSCKYSYETDFTADDSLWCNKGVVSEYINIDAFNNKDFGCNKYERIEDD